METIQIKWKSKKQQTLIKTLLKELKINFHTVASDDNNDDYDLYGEGFKQSVLEINKAYDDGDTSRFVEMEIEEIGLQGGQLQQVVLAGKQAFESGNKSQFTKIKTADLWK